MSDTFRFGDAYTYAPNMVAIPLLYVLYIAIALPSFRSMLPKVRAMNTNHQRKFVMNFLELVVSTIGLIVILARGFDILLQRDLDPAAFDIVRGLVCTPMTYIFLFKLVYRLETHWTMTLHHIVCIVMIWFCQFSVHNTAEAGPRLAVASMLFVFLLGHVVSDQVALAALMVHRLHVLKSNRWLRLISIQLVVLKFAFSAWLVYTWVTMCWLESPFVFPRLAWQALFIPVLLGFHSSQIWGWRLLFDSDRLKPADRRSSNIHSVYDGPLSNRPPDDFFINRSRGASTNPRGSITMQDAPNGSRNPEDDADQDNRSWRSSPPGSRHGSVGARDASMVRIDMYGGDARVGGDSAPGDSNSMNQLLDEHGLSANSLGRSSARVAFLAPVPMLASGPSQSPRQQQEQKHQSSSSSQQQQQQQQQTRGRNDSSHGQSGSLTDDEKLMDRLQVPAGRVRNVASSSAGAVRTQVPPPSIADMSPSLPSIHGKESAGPFPGKIVVPAGGQGMSLMERGGGKAPRPLQEDYDESAGDTTDALREVEVRLLQDNLEKPMGLIEVDDLEETLLSFRRKVLEELDHVPGQFLFLMDKQAVPVTKEPRLKLSAIAHRDIIYIRLVTEKGVYGDSVLDRSDVCKRLPWFLFLRLSVVFFVILYGAVVLFRLVWHHVVVISHRRCCVAHMCDRWLD